jgi:hypothetical protein
VGWGKTPRASVERWVPIMARFVRNERHLRSKQRIIAIGRRNVVRFLEGKSLGEQSLHRSVIDLSAWEALED